MANLLDYLEWRGDLTFHESPFNEVDNLILSQLAYINFDEVIPGLNYEETTTLEEASYRFHQIHKKKEISSQRGLLKSACLLMDKMVLTQRFKNIRLGKYISKLDYTEEKQFSALQYTLTNDLLYVAFRGTDDSIVGWKEDFNMSFMHAIPSQIEAVRYINTTLSHTPIESIYLGGHSKGGNLAIYASVYCKAQIKHKILHIYNNDGPGFNKQMLQNQDYQAILPKITTIVPQSSIVGMLLEHEEGYKIVKSKQIGFLQHNPMTWEVSGPHFITCDTLSKSSRILDHTIKNWLDHLDATQRQLFIDSLYTILQTTGAKTFKDLSHFKLKKINMLLKSYHALDDDTKTMLMETLKKIPSSYHSIFKDSLDHHSFK